MRAPFPAQKKNELRGKNQVLPFMILRFPSGIQFILHVIEVESTRIHETLFRKEVQGHKSDAYHFQ